MDSLRPAEKQFPAELQEKLWSILADVLQIDIGTEMQNIVRSEVTAWDSVNHLRLVAEIEQVFDTSLSDEEVITISSLSDIEEILVKRALLSTTSHS